MTNKVLKALVLLGAVLLAACASQGASSGGFAGQASQVYPAKYTAFKSNYVADPDYGDILEAARGKTSDGKKVMAVLARSSRKYDQEGAQAYYESQVPNPYRILIVIDEGTNRVVGSEVIRDGTTADVFTI